MYLTAWRRSMVLKLVVAGVFTPEISQCYKAGLFSTRVIFNKIFMSTLLCLDEEAHLGLMEIVRSLTLSLMQQWNDTLNVWGVYSYTR